MKIVPSPSAIFRNFLLPVFVQVKLAVPENEVQARCLDRASAALGVFWEKTLGPLRWALDEKLALIFIRVSYMLWCWRTPGHPNSQVPEAHCVQGASQVGHACHALGVFRPGDGLSGATVLYIKSNYSPWCACSALNNLMMFNSGNITLFMTGPLYSKFSLMLSKPIPLLAFHDATTWKPLWRRKKMQMEIPAISSE